MRAERNDFNVHLGDTIYSDSEVPGRLNPIALRVEQKWAQVQDEPRQRPPPALRGSAGFYSHWDDHEFVNDFSPAENTFDNNVNINGGTLYSRGVAGVPRLRAGQLRARNGLYRTLPLGQQPRGVLPRPALLPLGQGRRGRTSATTRRPASPDLAPTAPQTTRNVFAAVRRRCAAAGVAGLPRRDPEPEPDVPRQAPADALQGRGEALDARASR